MNPSPGARHFTFRNIPGINCMESDRSPWLIVCVSHLEWTESLFQRPQQVMRRLSQSHAVLFSYAVALREWSGMLLRGESVRQRLPLSANLTVLRERSLLPGWGGRLPQFQRFNDLRFMRALCRAASHVPPHRRILWYYYPQYLELIDALKPRIVVYECMDNYTALFSGNKDPAQASAFAAIQRDEPALLQRADIIFYGAHTLMEERPASRAKSHHIPTGVDVEHFTQAMTPGGVAAPDICTIRRPILGYWGAVDNRIDFELLTYAATTRPDWSFVLLGPLVALQRETIDHFLDLPNVHWLGPRLYEDIPNYARAFDVCLLPFKVSDEGRYLNPTKTLEYLATGKPVLSTCIPDVERFYSETVAIARTREEFVQMAQQLLKHDTDMARVQRVASAQNRSWETMVEEMWSLIEHEISSKADVPQLNRR
jgi:glycosyltransferase involved in cell wall biosynthesis